MIPIGRLTHKNGCSKNWNYKAHVSILYKRGYCSLGVENGVSFEYALRGKDWNVYWLLLKNGRPMSVREVQRALHFSSPSVAQHHLEQLRELGLLQKQDVGGNYFLASEIKIGVLRHFVKLGRLLFPRYFFYAVFSTGFYLIYVLALMQGFTRENLFILSFGAIVTAIFWYEAIRVWSMRPF
jgi:predicted DNA-binding transcriptional regulator